MILLYVRTITVSKTKISKLLLPTFYITFYVGYVNKHSLVNNYFSNVLEKVDFSSCTCELLVEKIF